MRSIQNLRKVIKSGSQDLAFVIGNGINRFKELAQGSSWNEILFDLWIKVYGNSLPEIPSGISLTEFYDLLELEIAAKNQKTNLQNEFCKPLSKWKYGSHHKTIVETAKSRNIPILTTNFDSLLFKAGGLDFYRFKEEPFTDYYPWGCYYGNRKLGSPSSGFGVWHINGMEKYHRSIRLGLTHYMGSVERARRMIHKGREESLFSGKNVRNWRGKNTWLHLVFNRSLFIFGLGLEESEVFLRWLLIERARYFRKFPSRKKSGWYVCIDKPRNAGKELFLRKLGFDYVILDGYEDIYKGLWIQDC